MNFIFLTETQYTGKYSIDHTNARTEFCWQLALDAHHDFIGNFSNIKGYDGVFVIIPKGNFSLNAIGCKLVDKKNEISSLLKSNFTEVLKENNKKIFFIQEGSTTLFNDMSVEDQFYYYNHLQNFDILFAHNDYDCRYYRGMFPGKKVDIIPTLMYTNLVDKIQWTPQDKVMIGGNFSRFYGGFQSYMVADEFKGCSKWTMDSHSKREDEGSIDDLHHLSRMNWLGWMYNLSQFKYAIHMMPIVAAGTFMLNCAYFGIPCIAPKQFNTQNECYPEITILSSEEVQSARFIANMLYEDKEYYKRVSDTSKQLSRESWHINIDKWKSHMYKVISNI